MDAMDRVRQLLREKCWTPYRLAKEANLPNATIGNMFRRNTLPTIPTLQAICGAFGITLAHFFSEGNMVEMTPELKELFNDWVDLTAEQKRAVRDLLKVMRSS